MIIKSSGKVETTSNDISNIINTLQSLNLPEGACLCSIVESRSMQEPYDLVYVLNFEWEVEV